jgi:quinol monooxygenase YgiN
MRSRAVIIMFASILAPSATGQGPAAVPAPAAPAVASESEAPMGEHRMRYGLMGSMGVKPGKRDEVIALLLQDVEELRAVGCDLYVVSVSAEHPDKVWVTEVWASREAHRASLALPSVQQAIAEARPLLTGEFEQVELAVVGGLGIPAGSPALGGMTP